MERFTSYLGRSVYLSKKRLPLRQRSGKDAQKSEEAIVVRFIARYKAHLKRLDEWIRHKLRCIRLKQCKRAKTIDDFLISRGVKEFGAWMLALSDKGWWRMAICWSDHRGMNLEWFEQQGLVSLSQRYEVFHLKRNSRGTK